MVDTFERAILHDGFSVVECLSECVMFYEGSFDDSTPRKGGVFETIDESQHNVQDDIAAYQLADLPSPGKFGVFYQVQRPTKNALEQHWIEKTQATQNGQSGRDLLRRRLEGMR